jgi:uncharacterized membrane protein
MDAVEATTPDVVRGARMKAWLWTYAAALLTIGLLDAFWLGFVARDFYRTEMASVAAPEVRYLPALLFYLLYPVGLLALAFWPAPPDLGTAVLRAALVGLVAYATYDLTNLATLEQWSWRLAAVDVAWGTLLSAAAGASAYTVWRRVVG